jgi:hypothetical protein
MTTATRHPILRQLRVDRPSPEKASGADINIHEREAQMSVASQAQGPKADVTEAIKVWDRGS